MTFVVARHSRSDSVAGATKRASDLFQTHRVGLTGACTPERDYLYVYLTPPLNVLYLFQMKRQQI